jgi:hypothetical protein
MPTKKERQKIVIQTWSKLIKSHQKVLAKSLTELDLSALHSWAGDCFESFDDIYFNLFEEIRKATPHDYELLHNKVVEIFWQLDHIKNHIIDAEKGFTELMNLLANSAEEKQKKK